MAHKAIHEGVLVNKLIAQKDSLIDSTHNLRTEALNAITDAELNTKLGGQSLSLRELILEQGTIQMAYIECFRSFELRFDHAAPEGVQSLEEIKIWFAELDSNLIAALGALSDDELKRGVPRGNYTLPAEIVFYTYRESVMIFAAKASVYLRALNHALPGQIKSWVG
jgi:hypothetical protein